MCRPGCPSRSVHCCCYSMTRSHSERSGNLVVPWIRARAASASSAEILFRSTARVRLFWIRPCPEAGLQEDHLVAGTRRDFADSRTHRSGSDDSDSFDLHGPQVPEIPADTFKARRPGVGPYSSCCGRQKSDIQDLWLRPAKGTFGGEKSARIFADVGREHFDPADRLHLVDVARYTPGLLRG